ncbi:carbohydrate sulfotransferase 12-like [Aplochiton taeniatus]
MFLLIILYWDDVSLYPLQEPKHNPHEPLNLYPRPGTTPGLLHSLPTNLSHPSSPSSVPSTPAGFVFSKSGTDEAEQRRKDVGNEVEKEEVKGDMHIREEDAERTREEKQKEDEKERRREVEKRRQEDRRRRIVEVCSGNGSVEFPGRNRTLGQIPNKELDHLIVDDKHQIIYCYVPKVACTNWKRVLAVLSQSLVSPSTGQPYSDPEAIPADLAHKSFHGLTLAYFWRRYGSMSRHLMGLKLQHYTKFLFVRDPFVRLISAFRNKFGRPNEDFYQQFGSVILRLYGNLSAVPASAEKAFEAGLTPTFKQFVSYLLDPESERTAEFNEHWRQVYRLCHPCQVQYDFIGRLETLEEDSDQLLRILGVDHLVHFPNGAHNRTAASWERDWFAQVPMAMRNELYRLYQPDFELFGYPKPEALLHM